MLFLCRIRGIMYVLNQVTCVCSKSTHRRSLKFIQCLHKKKRDEDKSIKSDKDKN